MRRLSSGTWKMLRSLSSIRLGAFRLRLGEFERAPGRLDRLPCRSARRAHLDGARHLELAAGEQLDGAGTAHDPVPAQPRRVPPGVRRDRRQPAHLDDLVLDPAGIVEPALGQAPLDRHLPALEPGRDAAAGPRAVTLVALPGGAADAGRRALAAPLRGPRGARGGSNVSDGQPATPASRPPRPGW